MSGFWSNIFKRPDQGDATLRLLASVPVFAELSTRELRSVERILYRRTYAASEVVFKQGDPGVGMYIIAEGEVQIRSEPGGQVLTTLKQGAFFGEIALLNEIPRSASAVATVPSVLWGFFQPELMDLLERRPSLGIKILLPIAQIAGERLVAVDGELRLYQMTGPGTD